MRIPTKFIAISFLLLAISTVVSAEVLYYHNDVLGSPVAATNEAGAVVWRAKYYPDGDRIPYAETGTPPSADNSRWYTGHEHDDDMGLTYMQARYYDPVVGRFMGVDPAGFAEGNPVSFNRYAYANNNPYKYVDPDGKYADVFLETISLGIGFASLAKNLSEGNYTDAAIDAGGLALDGTLLIIPGVPGVAGLGIKATREGGEAVAKRLVIGRGYDLANPSALQANEYILKWDSKIPDYKAEWKENSGRLRKAMRDGNPIRDASPLDKDGPFLNPEREMLEYHGWSFDDVTSFWNPPID